MFKATFAIILVFALYLAFKELQIFKSGRAEDKKKYADLNTAKETLNNEEIRSSVLDTEVEVAVRRADNDDLENEINSLEGDTK